MFRLNEIFTSRVMIASSLVLLFPLFINTLRHWASSIYILLALVSLTAIRHNKKDLRREEKILLAILLLHVLAVFTSNMLAGWTYASNRWFFAGEIRFLLAIPVYLYIRQIPDIWKFLLYGIPLGAIFIGLTGIIDFAIKYNRGEVAMIFAEGAYGHIFLGNIAILLSVLSYLAIGYFRDNRVMRWVCVAGAVLALIGAFASISRNAWLSIIILYAVALLISFDISKRLSFLRVRHFVALSALLLTALYFLSTIDYVKARFERVVEEPMQYFNADRSKPLPFTSIGFRLEQWRGVLIAFKEKPVFGHGVGNMGRVSNNYVKEGRLNQMVFMEHTEKTGRPTHVHSAYFEYLGDTGLVGFTLTMLLLFYPIYVAIRSRKDSLHAWRFVLMNNMAFAVAALTEVPFIRNNWTSVFLVFGTVFFAWLMHDLGKAAENENTYR